jgi:tetratricopeptide (TPR) repeat protein
MTVARSKSHIATACVVATAIFAVLTASGPADNHWADRFVEEASRDHWMDPENVTMAPLKNASPEGSRSIEWAALGAAFSEPRYADSAERKRWRTSDYEMNRLGTGTQARDAGGGLRMFPVLCKTRLGGSPETTTAGLSIYRPDDRHASDASKPRHRVTRQRGHLQFCRSVDAADGRRGRSQVVQPIEHLEPGASVRAGNAQSHGQPNATSSAAGFMVATWIDLTPDAKPPASQARDDVDQIMDYLSRKEFGKALELATKITQTTPNDPVGYNLQGGAYLGKRDYANARKSFDKALSLQPDNTQVLMNLAQLDVQQNDVPSARKRYQAILEKDPKFVLAMLGMAQLEASSGNESQSLAWLEKAKSASPDALAPRLNIAAHYLRTRNYTKALAELTEAQRSRPEDPEVLELLAQAQLAGGEKSQAIMTYKKLASIYPTSPVSYYRLALAQLNSEDYSGATESMKKAVQLKPDYEEAIAALAGLESRAGRPAEALKLARDLQKLAPKSPAGLTIEGDVFAAQGGYVDAAKAYEKAFAIRETGAVVVKLHAAYTKAGNAKAADAKIQRWLKDHPQDTGAWEYVALENLKGGRNKLAIEQYQSLLKRDPKNAFAMNNLANLYLREKDPRALDTAEQAYKLLPDSPVIADTLGWILVEQGTTRRGLELLQMAGTKDPKNTEVQYHLAAALAKSGEKVQARKILEPLLAGERAFPEREAAQLLLKQL